MREFECPTDGAAGTCPVVNACSPHFIHAGTLSDASLSFITVVNVGYVHLAHDMLFRRDGEFASLQHVGQALSRATVMFCREAFCLSP